MTVGCLVITTNLPHRLCRTLALLKSVDLVNRGLFSTKVLSVDLQADVRGCEDLLRQYGDENGWKVIQAPCTGERAMIHNILRGLQCIKEDILFYCEDHILVDSLPSLHEVENMIGGGYVSWVNFNTHILEENLLGIPEFVEPPGRDERMAFINDPSNWCAAEGHDYLIKETHIRDEYFLNFPAALAPRKVFAELLAYGMEHYSGVGIEIGFTQAWFDLGWDHIKQVAIITKPLTLDCIPFTSFGRLHQQACIQFRNNNPEMLHSSVVVHQTTPEDRSQRRSFF